MTQSQEFKLTLLLIVATILIIAWIIITVGYLYSAYNVFKAARRIKASSNEVRDKVMSWNGPRYTTKTAEEEEKPKTVSWKREDQ